MKTGSFEVKFVKLQTGLNKVAVPPASEFLGCEDGHLIILQLVGVAPTNEYHYWVFRHNDTVPADLLGYLEYVAAHVMALETIWRDRRYPDSKS